MREKIYLTGIWFRAQKLFSRYWKPYPPEMQHQRKFQIIQDCSPGAVSKYLNELVNNYEIIVKEEPVVMSRTRDTRYFLQDNFFNFWFRFIFKNSRFLEINPDKALNLIMKDLNSYFGKVFEKTGN